MISMRIKMFALNSMEKKCMNKRKSKKPYISKVFGTRGGFLIPF